MLKNRKICIGVISTVALMWFGCEAIQEGYDDGADMIVSESQSPLSKIDGMLTVVVQVAKYYDGAPGSAGFELSIGHRKYTVSGSNSHCNIDEVPDGAPENEKELIISCAWEKDNTWDADAPYDYQLDHPFADDPDDYDHMRLKNTSYAYSAGVKSIFVDLQTRGVDATDWEPDSGHYTFVDKSYSSTPHVISSQDTLILDGFIQQRRECIAKSAICGTNTDKNTCSPNAEVCTVLGKDSSGNDITMGSLDIEFQDFPVMVQEQIKDIGQPGSRKYVPVGFSSPCNEIYTYYAQQYSNGFYAGCDESLFDMECSYFQPLNTEATAKVFLQAGRLYKAIFENDIYDTDNLRDASGSKPVKFLECKTTDAEEYLCKDVWPESSTHPSYEPTSGDLLRRIDRWAGKYKKVVADDGTVSYTKYNGGHSDTLLWEVTPGFGTPAPTSYREYNYTTSQKSEKNCYEKTAADNWVYNEAKCTCYTEDGSGNYVPYNGDYCNTAKDNMFRWDWVVGVVDHEKKSDGNYGFYSTLVAIVN